MFNSLSGKAVLLSFVAATFSLFATSAAQASETASATIDLASTQGTGINTIYTYDLSLTNTGTVGSTIGTFWFSWIPGENFLASAPLTVSNPTGWNSGAGVIGNSSSGASIQFVASSGSDLAAGNTLNGFSFTTHETPSSVFGDSIHFPGTPVLTSFVYSGAPFSDSGETFKVQPVPEPAPLAMFAVVFGAGLLLLHRRRVSVRQ